MTRPSSSVGCSTRPSPVACQWIRRLRRLGSRSHSRCREHLRVGNAGSLHALAKRHVVRHPEVCPRCRATLGGCSRCWCRRRRRANGRWICRCWGTGSRRSCRGLRWWARWGCSARGCSGRGSIARSARGSGGRRGFPSHGRFREWQCRRVRRSSASSSGNSIRRRRVQGLVGRQQGAAQESGHSGTDRRRCGRPALLVGKRLGYRSERLSVPGDHPGTEFLRDSVTHREPNARATGLTVHSRANRSFWDRAARLQP